MTLLVSLTLVLLPTDFDVTFQSLLEDMVDRPLLAQTPDPPYRCHQASSYDRDSVAPDAGGWYANMDRSQFVRAEHDRGRTEYVLMDVGGPGAIVRFWATWHGARGQAFSNGTLRVYLDGSDQAVIEGPIAEILGGSQLAKPPLSRHASYECSEAERAHNLFLPIPYGNGCKVTYETDAPMDRGGHQGEALYYQINYRTYEEGVRVKSFTRQDVTNSTTALRRLERTLASGGRDAIARHEIRTTTETLAPNTHSTFSVEGTKAITGIEVKFECEDPAQALRSTILEMSFDGERTIWCPLGSFFGGGRTSMAYKTWYTEITEDGTMAAYWVMPFEKSATITFRNLGEQAVSLDHRLILDSWTWDERSMHFHAAWNSLGVVPTRGETNPGGDAFYDINYVVVEGTGVFVGDTLTIFNGGRAWWGEGDEKIWVDGEDFPSHFGTGTEDYYGYAWCRPEFFEAPFHAQPDGAGNLVPGHSVNSRYRSLDAIPFAERIQLDMEIWHWADTNLDYEPASFWYARPGSECNVEPKIELAKARVPRVREDIEIYRVEGALEGEDFTIVEKTDGTTEVQDVPQFNWSGDRQLWWRDAEPGSRLTLSWDLEEAGTFRVLARLTKANDYGIVRVGVDEHPAKEVDRYHPVVAHDEIELGVFKLEQGAHRLVVDLVDKNSEAVPRFMFGLDYLRLQSVDSPN